MKLNELHYPGDSQWLILQKAVRELALYYAGRLRSAQNFKRVSVEFLLDINRDVHRAVRDRVQRHPSRGRTLR